MAKLPPSVARLPVSPRWRFHGSGSKLVSDVVLDGRVADRSELGTLLRWTSLVLHVSFHRHVELTVPRTDARVAKALAAVRALAAAERWTLAGTLDLHGLGEPPARSAKKCSSAKLLGDANMLLLTFASSREPTAFARSGKPEEVQYAWQLVVTPWYATLHAPPTAKGTALLAKTFDALRANDAVTVMTLGHGHSGLLSAKSFRDGTFKCNGPFGSTQWVAAAFAKHDAELLAPIHRGHVGPRLLELPRARELAEKLVAANKANAKLDAKGVLWTGIEPSSPTERKPPALAAAKRFAAFARALHAEVAKDVTRKADARRKKRS